MCVRMSIFVVNENTDKLLKDINVRIIIIIVRLLHRFYTYALRTKKGRGPIIELFHDMGN